MKATSLLAMCLILCIASIACAADDEYTGDGYTEAPIAEGTRWVGFTFAIVAVVCVAVVGFKNSKRTHLD